MADVENQIFTRLATVLRIAFPGVFVQGRLTLVPSQFPCVCIEEADSYSYRDSRDTASNENHSEVMYEINVYSNKEVGAKDECKSIFAIADEEMNLLGFTRTAKMPIDTGDATKYRMIGRFQAVIGKDEKIYRR